MAPKFKTRLQETLNQVWRSPWHLRNIGRNIGKNIFLLFLAALTLSITFFLHFSWEASTAHNSPSSPQLTLGKTAQAIQPPLEEVKPILTSLEQAKILKVQNSQASQKAPIPQTDYYVPPENKPEPETVFKKENPTKYSPNSPNFRPEIISQAIPNNLWAYSVPGQLQGKIIHDIKPKAKNEKLVALTFDDGPWRKTTDDVLDILKQNNIKATFFWIGAQVALHPNIAKRIINEGHLVGNHTWHHWYHQMNEATASKEIENTDAVIQKTTQIKTRFFRPPGGYLDNGLAEYAQATKHVVVMWSVDSGDSQRRRPDAATITNRVLKNIKPGGIVLLHDGGGNHEGTVQALPAMIDGLRKQGYRFVTLAELFGVSRNQDFLPIEPFPHVQLPNAETEADA